MSVAVVANIDMAVVIVTQQQDSRRRTKGEEEGEKQRSICGNRRTTATPVPAVLARVLYLQEWQ